MHVKRKRKHPRNTRAIYAKELSTNDLRGISLVRGTIGDSLSYLDNPLIRGVKTLVSLTWCRRHSLRKTIKNTKRTKERGKKQVCEEVLVSDVYTVSSTPRKSQKSAKTEWKANTSIGATMSLFCRALKTRNSIQLQVKSETRFEDTNVKSVTLNIFYNCQVFSLISRRIYNVSREIKVELSLLLLLLSEF